MFLNVSRQAGVPHKVSIAFACSAAAFVKGPDNQALTAAAVTGSENPFKASGVALKLSADVAASVALDS